MPKASQASAPTEEIDRSYARLQAKLVALQEKQDRLIRQALQHIEQARVAHLKSRIQAS